MIPSHLNGFLLSMIKGNFFWEYATFKIIIGLILIRISSECYANNRHSDYLIQFLMNGKKTILFHRLTKI